ncbi:MAG: UDP-3-O-[3-hydroxymyristoyl] glucosamine N-acyltransferase [Proteobacteria bacterium]|nr:UDP-3-O-[3-hydroxymyristoyl] glucosamine N-acyltransferase [Pseudomonadota bacterium]
MPEAVSIQVSLAEIAARLGGDVLGDAQTQVRAVAPLESAGTGDISFLANPKYKAQLLGTRASAVIVPPDFADAVDLPRIVTRNPYAYYARLATLLNPPASVIPGVHPSALSASVVPASASIGPNACIGRDVRLGEGVAIHAGCVIGDGVSIGDGTVLYANVTIYAGCQIGRNTIIHASAVIGADGFGFAPDQGKWVKIPQIGRVLIGDDVEIGASTSIDRGALEDTVIGDGCKLDNLVHVGHNCRIGKNCLLCGCVGIAGSTTLQDNVIVGGAGMIEGHITIASGVVISGATTVTKSIKKPGRYTSIFPMNEHADWLHNAAHAKSLVKLAERVAELEKKLKNTKEEG